MTIALFASIFLKGLAAIIELVITTVITERMSVEGYGVYSFFVSSIDISFWILFSGLIKCNTFYLSDKSVSLNNYKKKYYTRYVLPIAIVSTLVLFLSPFRQYTFIPFCVILYLCMMDIGSTRLARGRYINSLLGEYLVGRVFLSLSVILFFAFDKSSAVLLAMLYSLQFAAIIVYYLLTAKKDTSGVQKTQISADFTKMLQYQQSDIAHGLVSQSPVILQYIFGSAFGAGFTAIVALVKKLVNFISGPTAKIFLPKFSEMYKKNDIDGLRSFYKMIVEIQMLFVAPVSVVLIGFPEFVLSIFDAQLISHKGIFMAVSAVFLIVATFGPAGGLMQMTSKEKRENMIAWSSIIAMGVVIAIMHKNTMFALYGMCAQGIVEGIGKYICACLFFKKPPVSVLRYLSLWMVPVILIAVIYALDIPNRFIFVLLFAGIAFIAAAALLLSDKKNRHNFSVVFSGKK